jgi:hypothetical protein
MSEIQKLQYIRGGWFNGLFNGEGVITGLLNMLNTSIYRPPSMTTEKCRKIFLVFASIKITSMIL